MYGERLKELRETYHLSQAQLALDLGTNQQSISRYEKELIEPNIAMIVKICDYFQVSADYLLGRTDY
ncbi:MAG TPA: helix-turn-helix domain-containing protein [Candidatus Borkfalkia stercoripullorum]|nr:helix-turn-helix domain-containing protein [Candidatus Borkfalkia stercoripullorum]